MNMKRHILITAYLVLLACADTLAQAEYPFGTIWKRVYDDEVVKASSAPKRAQEFLNKLDKDGSWKDIDYTSREITEWVPTLHFDRLKPMVSAYVYDKSPLYQDTRLYNGIIRALQYWADHDFESDNWWHNEIAMPKAIGVTLILLKFGKDKVPEDLEFNLVFKMIKGDPYAKTGANKSDIAMHYFYRALITQDKALLASSLEQLFYPVQLVDGLEGVQYDYSYLQHGPQLYIGGYGEEFLKGISKIMAYVRDTPYDASPERKELFAKFLSDTYLPIIRAGYIDFNVHGRGVSRPNILKKKSETNILKQMLLIDPKNKPVWDRGIAKLDSTIRHNADINPSHTHFWKADYTTHLRKDYHFNVRLASARTNRSEAGNKENIYGKFMTDGVTNIQVFGPEYYNIMPVWEWDKIPGTTTRDREADPVLVEQWGVPGQNNFAGGVSDGRYGATAMAMNYDEVTAKKSWFFFDKQIVCLGADITSTAPESITTTVNQAWFEGKAGYNNKGITKNDSLALQIKKGDVISHNSVLYHFPEECSLKLTTANQKGSWYKINNARSKDQVNGHVFKLWVDHGARPDKSTYAYTVYPGASKLEQQEADQLHIVENSGQIQAVHHAGLDILQAIFYEKGTLQTDAHTLHTEHPLIIQLGKTAEGFVAYVADPLQTLEATEITLTDNRTKAVHNLRVDLPKGPFKGSTAKVTIDRK